MASPVSLTEPRRYSVSTRQALKDVLEWQALLLKDGRSDKTGPADRAKLAQAWERLEERKRVLRGRPNPGSYRPSEPKRKPTPTLPPYTEQP